MTKTLNLNPIPLQYEEMLMQNKVGFVFFHTVQPFIDAEQQHRGFWYAKNKKSQAN